jgi:quercetin dioxygenase-like cupin family protein
MNQLKTTSKPWGYEKIWAYSNRENGYVGKIIHINEGCRLSLQKHKKKEETIIVLSGKLELVLENKTLILNPLEYFHITSDTIHRFRSKGGSCTLIEVNTKELDDIIRIEDDYGR